MALKRKNCVVQEIEYGACVADGALVAPSAFVADDASTDVEADDESTDVEEFVPPVQKGIKRSATLSVLDERFAAEIESDDVKSKRHFGNCLCVQNAMPPPTPFPKLMMVCEEEGAICEEVGTPSRPVLSSDLPSYSASSVELSSPASSAPTPSSVELSSPASDLPSSSPSSVELSSPTSASPSPSASVLNLQGRLRQQALAEWLLDSSDEEAVAVMDTESRAKPQPLYFKKQEYNSEDVAVEQHASIVFADVILWELSCNPFEFVSEKLELKQWVAFKVGLTHSPVYRHLKISPHNRSYSSILKAHCHEFKKMFVLWVGSAQGAARLEDDLIQHFDSASDKLENTKGGGEGAVDGTTTFVYAVANSLSEHMELRNALARKWVAKHSLAVALRRKRKLQPLRCAGQVPLRIECID